MALVVITPNHTVLRAVAMTPMALPAVTTPTPMALVVITPTRTVLRVVITPTPMALRAVTTPTRTVLRAVTTPTPMAPAVVMTPTDLLTTRTIPLAGAIAQWAKSWKRLAMFWAAVGSRSVARKDVRQREVTTIPTRALGKECSSLIYLKC